MIGGRKVGVAAGVTMRFYRTSSRARPTRTNITSNLVDFYTTMGDLSGMGTLTQSNESFTHRDCGCESNIAKNGFIAFLKYYSHCIVTITIAKKNSFDTDFCDCDCDVASL